IQPDHRDYHDSETGVDRLVAAHAHDEAREHAAAEGPYHTCKQPTADGWLDLHSRIRHEHVQEAESCDHHQVGHEAAQAREPTADRSHLLELDHHRLARARCG